MTLPASQSNTYERVLQVLQRISDHVSPKLSEPEIDRDFVLSNCIATLGYDAEQGCLQVEYFNGTLYRVDGVTEEDYQHLISADDFDQAFKQDIYARCEMTRIGIVLPVFT